MNNVSRSRTFIYSQEDMDVYNGSSSEGDGDDLPQFKGSIDGPILDSEFVLQPSKMTQSFQPGMVPLVMTQSF